MLDLCSGYSPDYQAMGDCRNCGRAPEDHPKEFRPGIGYAQPGECTPGRCGYEHGAKCFNAGRCLKAKYERARRGKQPDLFSTARAQSPEGGASDAG